MKNVICFLYSWNFIPFIVMINGLFKILSSFYIQHLLCVLNSSANATHFFYVYWIWLYHCQFVVSVYSTQICFNSFLKLWDFIIPAGSLIHIRLMYNSSQIAAEIYTCESFPCKTDLILFNHSYSFYTPASLPRLCSDTTTPASPACPFHHV